MLCADHHMHWGGKTAGPISDLKLEWQEPFLETSEFLNLELGVRENRSDVSQPSATFPLLFYPLFIRL